jgi:4'-phosphopantetheinyl transferase
MPDPVRRRRWEVGRVSLRRLLGDYLDSRPGSLVFAYAGLGKPILAASAGLHFNLAHAGRHALVAIARHRPVGVDLELARPLADMGGLARSLLPPSLAAAFTQLPPAVRAARLLSCWTRLEALGKLTGTGLGGGLAVLARPEGASLTSPGLRRGPCGDMWLEDVDAGPGMVAAVAVSGAAAVDLAWGEPNIRSASLR